jgi:hypothetical protein
MSYEQYMALSLFYDGPIPSELRRIALNTGIEVRRPRKRRAPVRTAEWLIQHMAETIRAVARRRGGRCERGDLLQAGFTPAEIARHQEDAVAKAAQDAEAACEHRGSPDIPVAMLLFARRLTRSA